MTFVFIGRSVGRQYSCICLVLMVCSEVVVGEWLSEGCELVSSNATHTRCQCHHLTHFGILMSVTAPVVQTNNLLTLLISHDMI